VSPRPQPFVPKLNQAEEGTLKCQLIELGMYTIATSFEAEAELAAKDQTPYAAYLARLIDRRWPTRPTALAELGRGRAGRQRRAVVCRDRSAPVVRRRRRRARTAYCYADQGCLMPDAALVAVSIEEGASDDELVALRELFAEAGIDAEVSADYGRKADIPDLAWQAIVFAAPGFFFKGYLETLGKRAGEGTADAAGTAARASLDAASHAYKAFMDKLHATRRRHTGQQRGTVTIIERGGGWVRLDDGLPVEAYRALADLDLKALNPRSHMVAYDRNAGMWRDVIEIELHPISPPQSELH
jgi:hypothetical protein